MSWKTTTCTVMAAILLFVLIMAPSSIVLFYRLEAHRPTHNPALARRVSLLPDFLFYVYFQCFRLSQKVCADSLEGCCERKGLGWALHCRTSP